MPLEAVESTVTGEQMADGSVRDLATCRKCVAHLVVPNHSQTVSDLKVVFRSKFRMNGHNS